MSRGEGEGGGEGEAEREHQAGSTLSAGQDMGFNFTTLKS